MLLLNKDQRMRVWAVTREEGENKFAIRWGAFQWGLLMVLMFQTYEGIWEPSPHPIRRLVFQLIFFPVAGYFVGKATWYRTEKEFFKYFHDNA